MTYFIITAAVLGLFFVFMGIGVVFGKDPLKGSCGGLGKLMGSECEICGKKDECEERLKKLAAIAEKSASKVGKS